MKQDGKEFSPANDAMLQQAADGELVLWAFIRRHTAKLCAFPWAVAPRQATRGCAAGLVPTMPELANDMLGFPGTTLKNYLATDPTDCLESHPWKDHYWVLDEPQAVTREQVYFQQPARKAAPVVAAGASDGGEINLSSVWWQESYDIPELWQNIGATLHSQKKRTSNSEIAKEIEKRINALQRSKGLNRASPSWDTIRGKFSGRVWKTD